MQKKYTYSMFQCPSRAFLISTKNCGNSSKYTCNKFQCPLRAFLISTEKASRDEEIHINVSMPFTGFSYFYRFLVYGARLKVFCFNALYGLFLFLRCIDCDGNEIIKCFNALYGLFLFLQQPPQPLVNTAFPDPLLQVFI